jgi:hypothetical protein
LTRWRDSMEELSPGQAFLITGALSPMGSRGAGGRHSIRLGHGRRLGCGRPGDPALLPGMVEGAGVHMPAIRRAWQIRRELLTVHPGGMFPDQGVSLLRQEVTPPRSGASTIRYVNLTHRHGASLLLHGVLPLRPAVLLLLREVSAHLPAGDAGSAPPIRVVEVFRGGCAEGSLKRPAQEALCSHRQYYAEKFINQNFLCFTSITIANIFSLFFCLPQLSGLVAFHLIIFH